MSTQLRELFETAADSQPPNDLAVRAIAGARSRCRQRFTVAGSALVAAAIVVGVVMVNPSQRTDSAPRPNEVVSLPEVLPVPDGLPELSEAPMDSASVAYTVDSQVVVIDAATAEGARLDLRMPTISGRDERWPFVGSDASLALSPDGRFLMVASGAKSFGTVPEWMVLVDVTTGEAWLQAALQLASVAGRSSVIPSRMAWSPDGQTFACICSFEGQSPQLVKVDMATMGDDGDDLSLSIAEETGVTPRQISWGTYGLVAHLETERGWSLLSDGGPEPPLVPEVDALALAHDAPELLAIVDGDRYAVTAMPEPAPPADFWAALPAGPVSSIQALADDFVLVSRPLDAAPGEPAPPTPLFAHRLTQDAAAELITTFPSGTTATSFAAAVDAIG